MMIVESLQASRVTIFPDDPRELTFLEKNNVYYYTLLSCSFDAENTCYEIMIGMKKLLIPSSETIKTAFN